MPDVVLILGETGTAEFSFDLHCISINLIPIQSFKNSTSFSEMINMSATILYELDI